LRTEDLLPEALQEGPLLQAVDLRAEGLRAGHLRAEDLLPEALQEGSLLQAEDLRAKGLRTGLLRSFGSSDNSGSSGSKVDLIPAG
jgi:hypothetical protein